MKKGVRVKKVVMTIVPFAEGVCMAFVLSKATLVIANYLFLLLYLEKRKSLVMELCKIQPKVEGCLNKMLGLNKVAHM
jgi:hypothetical protein